MYGGNSPVLFSDPSGREFSIGGMMSGMAIHNSLQQMKADVDTRALAAPCKYL